MLNKMLFLKGTILIFSIFILFIVITNIISPYKSEDLAQTTNKSSDIKSDNQINTNKYAGLYAKAFENAGLVNSAETSFNSKISALVSSTNSPSFVSATSESGGSSTPITGVISITGRVTSLSPPQITLANSQVVTLLNSSAFTIYGQPIVAVGSWSGLNFLPTSVHVPKTTYPVTLTIGDSITYQGGGLWNNWGLPGWGMNASDVDHDYFALIKNYLRLQSSSNAQVTYHSFGFGSATGKLIDITTDESLERWHSYRADLVTIQIGENDGISSWGSYSGGYTDEKFQTEYNILLDSLLDNTPRPRIICYGAWWVNTVTTRENYMRSSCESRGLPFISMIDAYNDLSNRESAPCNDGRSLDGATCAHPNDSGMQEYADRFGAVVQDELTGT